MIRNARHCAEVAICQKTALENEALGKGRSGEGLLVWSSFGLELSDSQKHAYVPAFNTILQLVIQLACHSSCVFV